MKQKFKIVREYDGQHKTFFYYGYKYVFFNLIPVYVMFNTDFDIVKDRLVCASRKYAKVVVDVFWSD